MSIESKGYIATPNDITALTQEILGAAQAMNGGKATYLRALIGTTVDELGAPVRAHAKKAGKLKQAEITAHLAALEAVHTRFYEAVVAAASDHLPTGKGEKALELNRRTNFARSSMSTVRGYIRAGNDITALVPARVVKAALAVPRTVKPVSPKRLRSKVEKLSKAFMAQAIALAEVDAVAAVGELEMLMGQLADQVAAITQVRPVKDIRQAVAGHKPYRHGDTTFIPLTATQVVRQSARPS